MRAGTAKMTFSSGPWAWDVLPLLQQRILGCRREREKTHTNKAQSCTSCDAGCSSKSLQCGVSCLGNMAVQVLQLQFSCSPLGCNPFQENSCGNSVVYPWFDLTGFYLVFPPPSFYLFIHPAAMRCVTRVMQSRIYSEFSQWGVTGAMVGTAVNIQRRGGGFGVVASYHVGQCVSAFYYTQPAYKNIIRGLRMVIRSIQTLFTTLVIWCRPGSSGDTSTSHGKGG